MYNSNVFKCETRVVVCACRTLIKVQHSVCVLYANFLFERSSHSLFSCVMCFFLNSPTSKGLHFYFNFVSSVLKVSLGAYCF